MSDAFKPLLARLADGATLDAADAEYFFAAALRGEPTPAQVAAAVTAMRMRGETVGEVTACARVMRRAALTLKHPHQVIDVCGTGGTGLSTFNVSTAVAMVAAGAGLKVAKHGNRTMTRRSGSADVLTALGVNIQANLEQQRRALEEAGMCFMFAPAHHGAMRHVLPIRQELGFWTVFNLLGPLANPAGAQRQVLGVLSARWVEPLAHVLGALGAEKAWVVHGEGLDEMTTTGDHAGGRVAGRRRAPVQRHARGGRPAAGGAGGSHRRRPGRERRGDPRAAGRQDRRLPRHRAAQHRRGPAGRRQGRDTAGRRRAGGRLDRRGPRGGGAGQAGRGDQPAVSDILEQIAAYKRDEVAAARRAESQDAVEARARSASPPRGFRAALERAAAPGRLALIAEVKKASPSKGLIRADFDPPALARAYEAGGAACLSVLTDAPSFQGADAYLTAARDATALPALRKEFLVDPWQVAQSRALGADAILVILAISDDTLAGELLAEAARLGMDALVEAHDEAEVDRAVALGAGLIGVNNRNLRSFVTDLAVTERLAARIPDDRLLVTESGIAAAADIARLAAAGARAMLVGESLMRQARRGGGDAGAAGLKIVRTASQSNQPQRATSPQFDDKLPRADSQNRRARPRRSAA